MHLALLVIAAFALLFWSSFALEMWLGYRRMWHLAQVPPLEPGVGPSVSIIVPACNEEKKIETAMHSLLKQDYHDYEIVAIDDRSTDRTGEILDRLALANPHLQVDHITQLPDEWLGKNHALHDGASRALGEWLLFTDADVVMEPGTLRRALAHAVGHKRDHLTLSPEVIMPGTLLKMFTATFVIFFSMFSRPWDAVKPKSRRFVGVGAFNLVRAEVYRAIGGHSRIAMRPDDDMKLGKIIKQGGYSQEALIGHGVVSVEWYSSLREVIHGLTKNMFSGVDYSIGVVVLSIKAMLTMFIWPFVAVCVTTSAVFWLNLGAVAIILALFAHVSPYAHGKWWHGVGFPVVCGVLLYIMARSTLLTLRSGGITWRGTFYPLDQLRRNAV